MSGILDKKTKFLDFVVTEIGKRNLSKNFSNWGYFSLSDSIVHYSGSDYGNNIIVGPADSVSFDRFSLTDVKWSVDSLRSRFAFDDLYRIDKDTSLYNLSDRYKYVPNVNKADEKDLLSSSFKSDISEYGPYLGKIAIDSNRLVRNNYKDDKFYLDGRGLFGENIADDDPTVSFGYDETFIEPYSLNVLNSFVSLSDIIELDDKPSLFADTFTKYVLNYMFLPPKVLSENGSFIDVFVDNDGSLIDDVRGLPQGYDELNEHFDQTIMDFIQNAGENIASYEISNSKNRDNWLKIEMYEIVYNVTQSRRKIFPLDVIKIRENFWIVGKFSVEPIVGKAEQKDLNEKKFFPIFGVFFEESSI